MSQLVNRGHFVDGQWMTGNGPQFNSVNPADSSMVWHGAAATSSEVTAATMAAREAWQPWWDLSQDRRIEYVLRFAEQVKQQALDLAKLISRENGKPLWESKTEVNAVIGKSALAVEALHERRDTTSFAMDGYQAVTRYKPFGALGVLGPFNFPAHLPNGHIIPALIAGNTIVFKPSEMTPRVGQWMVERWQEIGLPSGVINLVQGGRETGIALANDPNLDGLLFTGSSNAGVALHRTFAQWPQKILALEMGGNNPLIACEFSDAKAAAYTVLQSAFLTAGQRCTCARRLIVIDRDPLAEKMLRELQRLIDDLTIGYWDDPAEPFIGPVISPHAGKHVVDAQQSLIEKGGHPISELKSWRDNPALLSPGIIDVTSVDSRSDHEVFGPLLSLIRVADFDAAIVEANRTAYGLAAGLISDNPTHYQEFIKRIRAGVVNWNRQTTGASGKLPFGGWGLSGNHRPGGYFAADYCSWPVASLESERLEKPTTALPGVKL